MNPAEASRLRKEKSPELYCPKCLWRLSSGDCPRHMKKIEAPTTTEE